MRIILVGPVPIRDASKLLLNRNSGAFTSYSNDRGVSVLMTAKALLNRGHFVSIITTDINADRIEVFQNERFRLIIVPRRKKLKTQIIDLYSRERKLLMNVIDNEPGDIVNAQWTYEFALAAIKSSKPCVVTAHDAPLSIFLKFRDFLRFLHLIIAIRVRILNPHLIFVSPYLAMKWRYEMIWKGTFEIVPNIALPPIKQKKEDNYLKKCISVTESGRLKNSATLIKSWSKVIKKDPEAILFLVGHGMNKGGELHRWAQRKGLDFGIEWKGHLDHDQVLKEICSSNLLISTSRQESFGLTILEAMSLGVPVVAGIESGATSWVLGKSGILVDVENVNEISSAIISILNNRNLQKKMSKEGLARATSEFSEEIVCKKLEEIYSIYSSHM